MARYAAMTPEQQADMWRRQKEGYIRSEMSWGDEGTRVVSPPPRTGGEG